MRILVASDSFKDGCSSREACLSIAHGLQSSASTKDIEICPISDGGEGAAEILQFHLGGRLIDVEVSDPLFRRIRSKYLITKNGIAFIEMAQASGLELLSQTERNPMNTSTFGTGEMIQDALGRGCKEIVITVGGSATNDLGMGMASALGWQFVDCNGIALAPIGANLSKVRRIIPMAVKGPIRDVPFKVITDVDNPMFGDRGASFIFGPQKGGTLESIALLDDGIRHLTGLIEKQMNISIANLPGAGAAGGLGGGCVAFLKAEINSGINQIGELVHLEQKIKAADIIITGEGHLDSQSAGGKVVSGISRLAKKHGKKVIAFCGLKSISVEDAEALGIHEIIPISEAYSEAELEFALANTNFNLESKAKAWAIENLR